MALKLDIRTMNRDQFKSTILELLNNKKYSKQAKIRSNNFRDQKETPIERAMWWIDYVSRNPDISFLKSSKLQSMNYVVKHSIDIIAFLTIITFFSIHVIAKIVLIIVRSQRKKKQKLKSQ